MAISPVSNASARFENFTMGVKGAAATICLASCLPNDYAIHAQNKMGLDVVKLSIFWPMHLLDAMGSSNYYF